MMMMRVAAAAGHEESENGHHDLEKRANENVAHEHDNLKSHTPSFVYQHQQNLLPSTVAPSYAPRNCSNKEKNISVMERAQEFITYLGNKSPTFAKLLLPSQVSGGFWLGFPKNFCHLHLPNHDAIIKLVDEKGEDYGIVYLARRAGLSGGWRRFCMQHKLQMGDGLVFQLIESTKFRVFIVRENCLCEVDGAVGLMDLAHNKTSIFSCRAQETFMVSPNALIAQDYCRYINIKLSRKFSIHKKLEVH